MLNEKYLLILDCNFLCYRSMEMLKGLSYENLPTGVIYGFLAQLQRLAELFNYPKFVFAWDSIRSYRKDTFPGYKNRKVEEDQELIALHKIGKPQFLTLRTSILPSLGFSNILLQSGLEADDMIAKFINQYYNEIKEEIMIISRDNDLYQLLDDGISLYDPITKEITTKDDFIKKKGIQPKDWVFVKAVAGCTSDTIPGCKNVAEKSVIQYLLGTLKMNSRIEAIKTFDPTFNYSLVKLPHRNTMRVPYYSDNLNLSQFEKICSDYGLGSFLKKENYNKWRKILS